MTGRSTQKYSQRQPANYTERGLSPMGYPGWTEVLCVLLQLILTPLGCDWESSVVLEFEAVRNQWEQNSTLPNLPWKGSQDWPTFPYRCSIHHHRSMFARRLNRIRRVALLTFTFQFSDTYPASFLWFYSWDVSGNISKILITFILFLSRFKMLKNGFQILLRTLFCLPLMIYDRNYYWKIYT